MKAECTEFTIKGNTANSNTKVIQVSVKMLASTFNGELGKLLESLSSFKIGYISGTLKEVVKHQYNSPITSI